MKKHLNTLFITTQGAWLSKERECILVTVDKTVKKRFPIHNIGGVVCFGRVTCSPFLLGHCAENGVTVSFLSKYGRFLAKVQGNASGNVLLRRQQYRTADSPEKSAAIARYILTGKIAGSRSLIMRTLRNHPEKVDSERLKIASRRLADSLKRLDGSDSLDSLRGIEGEAGNAYFGVFDQLITRTGEEFRFTGRNRRPPLDPVNSLLSFVYTIMLHDIRSALECTGLDPAVGFLHRDRPGRPSLALDLMEEFRPFFADRLVLSLINRGEVKPAGFKTTESGSVVMNEATRKKVLTAYQTRKQDEMLHPFLKEKMNVGLLWHMQARLMARYIRGDMEGYPAILWK